MVETEENGALAAGDVTGSGGGTLSGLGGWFNRDTRDNIFYSTQGSLCEISGAYYAGALGCDFDFGRYGLDLRKFFSMGERQVVALQSLVVATSGDPPFQMLAQLGGDRVMRGYYNGRFRDRHAAVLQAEYRVKVWWRIGAAAFAGVGDVAHRPADFRIEDFKYSLGGGLRFLLSRQEGMNLRIDSAFGDGTSGFYITLGEPF
jgi:outer membrane protein assembly factor BamA